MKRWALREAREERVAVPVPVIVEEGAVGPVRIDPAGLSVIGDRFCLRDARGRSMRPSLERRGRDRQGGSGRLLQVRGPFSALQRFTVAPEEGAAFAAASRDENPIHTSGRVVPGAMIAARALIFPEVVLGESRVERARIRFRALASYDLPTVNLYRFQPLPEGGFRVDVQVRQEGVAVADAELHLAGGGCGPAHPATGAQGVRERETAGRGEPALAPVESFLRSLRIDPALYFRGAGPVYPRAYLAALPSGEMVRRFSGEGGLLNALDLEFPAEAALGSPGFPTVELEHAPRARKTFRKIIARIVEGVRTCCSGFAMVLPGAAAGGASR